MSKKRTIKKPKPICGDQCPNCTHIGDGDYMCDKFDEPIIVLTDFSCPTQELRDTIVKHIVRLNNVCKTNAVCKDCKYADYDRCTEYAIADALIAAGIGDVKEEKFEADHYWNMWQGALVELERAERRAEVYYEALLSAAAYGDTPPEYYIEQAEKELAEENNGKKEV